MSYHLRQLARHRLVLPSDRVARGRERWWEAGPSALAMGGEQALESASGRTAFQVVAAERLRQRNADLIAFFTKNVFSEPRSWQEAAFSMTEVAWLEESDLRALSKPMLHLMRSTLGDHRVPGPSRRAVSLRFDGFPLPMMDDDLDDVTTDGGKGHDKES
jgi:hypothetical protein